MDKTALRKSTIDQLKKFSKSDKKKIEKNVTTHLVTTRIWEAANTIGVTMAQGYEWDTKLIIEHAWKQNKTVCVPKCDPIDKKLTFYQLTSYDQLEVVYYNLKEPKPNQTKKIDKIAIDLLIVPGLVFDKSGYRIGFGGGYYDRFLIDYPNETASLMHDSQIVEELPRESFDLPVTHLITDRGIVSINQCSQ